jgi:hypothetical protein
VKRDAASRRFRDRDAARASGRGEPSVGDEVLEALAVLHGFMARRLVFSRERRGEERW